MNVLRRIRAAKRQVLPRHLLVGVILCLIQDSLIADEQGSAADFFENKIRPILVNHCYDCHGPNEAEGKLRLDSRNGWERGGDQGPAIVPGDPSASLLIRAVSHRDPELQMPPDDAGGRLSDEQIEDLTTWIHQGAFDPRTGEKIITEIEAAARQHWAFQPIVPPVVESDAHAIDTLIDRLLKERKFAPAEAADLRTLVRRATFDLHGLPPTAEQLRTTRENFPQLIQTLLASPHYGERWGRHWLDVARYSDAKDGVLMYGDARIRPFAYTYRDYVIQAFNEDKPFDQFIREQLAADQLELKEHSPELAALGLLTLGRMFDRNPHDVIDDQIDVITRGFLGLTVSCARCHDHKFDPVPTADYYSLYGIFASCVEPYDRPRIGPVTDAGDAFEQEFSAKLKEVYEQQQSHYDEQLRTARERTPDYLVQVATTEPDVAETAIFFLSLIPDQLRPQITRRWRQLIARRAFSDDPIFGPWHDLMHEPVLKQDEWRKRGIDSRIISGLVAASPQSPAEVARVYGEILRDVWMKGQADPSGAAALEADPIGSLLVSRESPVWFPREDVANYLSRQPGDAYRGLLGQLDAIAVKHRDAPARAMVVMDSQVLCEPVIFQRGDPSQRGTPVPRQFLKVLSPRERPAFHDGSGRLNLANAIASPENPLTARVWVNRVWMHHFGESLVENPGDFGIRTQRPVHHELLDFLADFFVRHGWRTKPLHELIMASRAYQRTSLLPENDRMKKQLESDPANSLIWHGNRRRLDFEQMRDSLLFISGQLDETMFGRPQVITETANHRRTVYAFVERQNIPSMVQTFDFANADTSTSRRSITTVPQQALFAMNSDFLLGCSKALANGAEERGSPDKITDLYLTVYGRKPTEDEIGLANEFLVASSFEQLAQVLLMSNELMFVD